MQHVLASELRKNLSDAINRVVYAGERVTIMRRNRPLAVLVSVEDAAILEQIEDRMDVAAAQKAIEEGGESIPWEDAKRQLGL
ncbi:type II toxin-antitoxin system Phd/YefM family antitoxin [Candidatus Fermentibacteria bacterium]|nr:type II toxin-antitoxin system Phd/YefM family antitoxin [Candidatus Fermentibacteria bacterium]